jgi:hypothetical protein
VSRTRAAPAAGRSSWRLPGRIGQAAAHRNTRGHHPSRRARGIVGAPAVTRTIGSGALHYAVAVALLALTVVAAFVP